MPRPGYDRGVHRARQAPRTVGGLVLIALAAISWGTSGSVMTVLAARAAASPLLVGVARLWLAAILLVLATSLTPRPFVIASGDRWRCLAMGACMAGYQAAYFTAVTLGGIAVVALVAICSAPLMIAALAPWLLGERLAPRVRAALVGVGRRRHDLARAADGDDPGHRALRRASRRRRRRGSFVPGCRTRPPAGRPRTTLVWRRASAGGAPAPRRPAARTTVRSVE